jgi:hypothetical protein
MVFLAVASVIVEEVNYVFIVLQLHILFIFHFILLIVLFTCFYLERISREKRQLVVSLTLLIRSHLLCIFLLRKLTAFNISLLIFFAVNQLLLAV